MQAIKSNYLPPPDVKCNRLIIGPLQKTSSENFGGGFSYLPDCELFPSHGGDNSAGGGASDGLAASEKRQKRLLPGHEEPRSKRFLGKVRVARSVPPHRKVEAAGTGRSKKSLP